VGGCHEKPFFVGQRSLPIMQARAVPGKSGGNSRLPERHPCPQGVSLIIDKGAIAARLPA